MTSIDPALSAAKSRGAFSASLRLAPALYAATLFASALLLFAVQPMFTKMVLPYLGGAPAVWSVAMVFFQGTLLLGYFYAHAVVRHLSQRSQVVLHGSLILLACLAWVVFSVLLWGRNRLGWRGHKAIRWTLAGFCLLMLAYFGSKLVREYILHI